MEVKDGYIEEEKPQISITIKEPTVWALEGEFSSKALDELTTLDPSWTSAYFLTNGKFRAVVSRTYYEDCKRVDEEFREYEERCLMYGKCK